MPMAAAPHPYKVVAPFIDGFLRTEALAAAFELGIVRALEPDRVAMPTALATQLSLDPFHLQILLDILTHDGVLQRGSEGVSLAEGFRKALVFRDLLEVRMEFGRRHSRTVMDNYAASIRDTYRNQGQIGRAHV